MHLFEDMMLKSSNIIKLLHTCYNFQYFIRKNLLRNNNSLINFKIMQLFDFNLF